MQDTFSILMTLTNQDRPRQSGFQLQPIDQKLHLSELQLKMPEPMGAKPTSV